MRFAVLNLLTCAVLTACASASAKNFHKLASVDDSTWEMVSLKGLDEALNHSYVTKSMPVELGGLPIALEFEGIDFETFKNVSTSLQITTDSGGEIVYLGLNKSCAAVGASYELVKAEMKFKSFHQPGPACDRVVPGASGKLYSIPTQYLIQVKFMEIAPEVSWYIASSDGQTLTLLDSDNQKLGVFSLQETAK